jgi:hypothetical protein
MHLEALDYNSRSIMVEMNLLEQLVNRYESALVKMLAPSVEPARLGSNMLVVFSNLNLKLI